MAGNGEGRRENGTEMRAKQKSNQNGRNPAEVRGRERQRMRDRRRSSRRKTGSNLITASLRPSLFLLIVSQVPA